MFLVVKEDYNSTVLNNKAVPASTLKEDGTPAYLIFVDKERAEKLIKSGVAEEYNVDLKSMGEVVSNDKTSSKDNVKDPKKSDK